MIPRNEINNATVTFRCIVHKNRVRGIGLEFSELLPICLLTFNSNVKLRNFEEGQFFDGLSSSPGNSNDVQNKSFEIGQDLPSLLNSLKFQRSFNSNVKLRNL